MDGFQAVGSEVLVFSATGLRCHQSKLCIPAPVLASLQVPMSLTFPHLATRRFMAAEPDKWDYAAAGIPSALTDDMEASQAAKKVARP